MNPPRLIKPIYVLAFLLVGFTSLQLAAQNATCENVKKILNEGTQTETNTGQSEYWYSFQTPNDEQNRDLTVAATGTTISIFNFPCVANDLIISSAPGFGTVTASALIPNTAYIIKIVGSSPGAPFNLTSFTLTTTVSSGGGGGGGGPINNTCEDAIVITANGTQIVTSTGEAEYWYQFVMPSTPSNLELSSDPGANIAVTVYTGADCNSLTIRAQGTSANVLTVTTLTPNSVVWIKWAAQLGTTGSFVLNALPTGGGGGGSNQAPTNISLDKTTLNSSDGAFTVVGNLSTTDPDANDTFTYTLVSGTGSTDNASFDIMPLPVSGGAQLLITVDANTKASYSARIRSTDLGGLSFEKAFTITVNAGGGGNQTQTITFNTISAKTYGEVIALSSLGATSSSGLPVSYQVSSGPANINAGNLTFTGVGTVTIEATQTGDNDYAAATPVQQSITVNAKALTISGITASNKVYNGNSSATLTGTATLNGIINSDDVTLSGTPVSNFSNADAGNNKSVTVTGYTLSGTKSGNYSLTQPTGITANITKADQTITFNAITASIEVGGSAFSLGATATSSLAISYTATPTGRITIDANGNATPVGGGNVEITASQAGNNNYNAATSVKQTVCIAPVAPVVIVQTQSGKEVLTTANAQILSWFKEGTTTAISTGVTFNPASQVTAAGIYYAKADAGGGCVSKASNKFTVSVITGLEDLSQVASIWPNPTSDYLFVDNVSAEATGKVVQLNGSELELPRQYTNNRLQLDVRALAPGIYVLKLVDGNNIRATRIVKN
jgi:YDG domain/Secretion system C-terminal sorting domain